MGRYCREARRLPRSWMLWLERRKETRSRCIRGSPDLLHQVFQRLSVSAATRSRRRQDPKLVSVTSTARVKSLWFVSLVYEPRVVVSSVLFRPQLHWQTSARFRSDGILLILMRWCRGSHLWHTEVQIQPKAVWKHFWWELSMIDVQLIFFVLFCLWLLHGQKLAGSVTLI